MPSGCPVRAYHGRALRAPSSALLSTTWLRVAGEKLCADSDSSGFKFKGDSNEEGGQGCPFKCLTCGLLLAGPKY